jgi:hypothetical protein
MFGRTSSLTGESRLGQRRVRVGSAVMAILMGVAVTANLGCNKQEQKVVKERAVNVKVWTAENRSLRPFVESIGTLNPYDLVNVSSELDGILKFLNDQLAFARDNFRAVTRQFEFGLSNSLDVMDANTLLVSAERKASSATYNYRLALLMMKKSTGHLLETVAGR